MSSLKIKINLNKYILMYIAISYLLTKGSKMISDDEKIVVQPARLSNVNNAQATISSRMSSIKSQNLAAILNT